VSAIRYLQGDSSQVFSRLEQAIIDFLSKCPGGAAVHEIVESVGCFFKSLYGFLKIFEKSGWVMVTRKSEGRVGRPMNTYKLIRDDLESTLRELCGFRGNEVNLNPSNVIYPYSLTIFKRITDMLKQNELLILSINHAADYRSFLEVAYKKNFKPLSILFNGSRIKILFRRSSTAWKGDNHLFLPQQILGTISPNGGSSILYPPITVFTTTKLTSSFFSLTSPIISASL